MSITPICNACGNELDIPGALIFSPPVGESEGSLGVTTKYHLCVGCFDDHFVVFTAEAWTVEHSFACRLSGAMSDCPYTRTIQKIADESDPDMLGRWRILDIDSEGLPSLERA